jgi:hypothetical protein
MQVWILLFSRGPHPDLLQRRRPPTHSPCFSKILITISISENVEYRYKVEVVVIKFIKDMQHRLLSFGEEEGR